MTKAIILTGGAGFIGSRIAGALHGRSERIVAIDNMHPQVHRSPERPADFPQSAELIVADVRDAGFWDKFLAEVEPTVVVHLAAETGTGQSLTESARHASVNVLGTAEMLDAFTRAGRTPEHLVLTSSRAVYGEGAWRAESGEVFYPKLRDHLQLEKAIWDIIGPDGNRAHPVKHRAATVFPKPSSIYGATKLAQENMVVSWASAMKIPVSIFRFQNVYGPGQSPFNPYTGIITLFHRLAHRGEAIDVYEDGQVGRDFVFIDDVVKACVAAIESPPQSLRTLDVGTGVATTILEAAELIAEIHGAPAPRVSGKFRDGDIRWAFCDTDDLYADLGVRSEKSFLEGARLVGEWLIAKGFI